MDTRAPSLPAAPASEGFGIAGLAPLQQPEKRLQVAVLLDAIAIYRRSGAEQSRALRRQRARERRWFMSESTHSPFAFESICDSLGLDAGCIRAHLLKGPDAHATSCAVNVRKETA